MTWNDLIGEEIKVKYEVKNMSELTKPQMRKYKIDKTKSIKGSKHYMYVHENVLIPVIMQ